MKSSKLTLSHLLKLKSRYSRMPAIGSRELDVLEVLWQEEYVKLSAIDVQKKLSSECSYPYQQITVNTVQSTLERLVKKKLLGRNKISRAFYYYPIVPKQELIGGLIRDIAKDMSDGDMNLMISGFMDFVSAEDPMLSKKMSKALDSFNLSTNKKRK